MKYSNERAPRQMSECFFETGNPSITSMGKVERRGHAVLQMVCIVGLCVFFSLYIAGVLQ